MSDFDIRREALAVARELDNHGSIGNLLNNADTIEAYLSDGLQKKKKLPEPNKLDFDRVIGLSQSTELRWSGAAQDLLAHINTGPTLVLKSRQIGFTTLMSEFAKHQAMKDKTILWLVPTTVSNHPIAAPEGTLELEKMMSNILVMTFRQFLEVPVWPRKFDYTIVDSMASLSYSSEEQFLKTIFPISEKMVFASEAGQARGLFYEMWNNPMGLFSKVHLTWWTPLYSLRKFEKSPLDTVGVDYARNSYLGVFRPIAD